MTTTLRQLNHYNPLADSRIFGLVVLLALPALLFGPLMSPWAPPAASLGLLIVVGLHRLATGRLLGQTPLDGPLLLLLLLLPVGLAVTAEPSITLPRTYAVIANVAIFLAVAAQRESPWLHHSGWVLLWGGLVLGVALVLGTNFGSNKLPFIDREIYTLLPGGWRPFWNPAGFNSNLSGGLLALFWTPAVILIWLGNSWQQRDFAKLVVVVLTVLLLLTQSRGALLGIGLALLVITLLHDRRWAIAWGLVLVGLLGLVYQSGAGPLLESILGRSDLFGDGSLQGRQQLWQQAILIIRDFPLTGVGLGMFEPTVRQLYAPEALTNTAQAFKHAHNLYLQAGAEMGLPGLGGHLAIYLPLLYLLWRRASDRRVGYERTLALGLLGSLIVFLTHGFFEVITYAPRAAVVVWALFGLMVAVTTRPVSAEKMERGNAPIRLRTDRDTQTPSRARNTSLPEEPQDFSLHPE